MSSKETVSVVGSEVMPLEYGGMDLESSPSSLERTVEGVGGGEVVGVGGDSVPITVVEVEGRRERCYDVDADIVEEVKQYESELGTRDSLGYLVESYEISSGVLIRPAGVKKRACSAPWDHWMSVYAYYFAVGLRFPILELLKAKRANQNKFSLNEDEEEEVGKLVREGGDLVNISYLTSAECIEAVELYGSSALSKAEMDKFLNAAGGVAIPKKPRKKSKTSTKQVDEEGVGREVVPNTSAEVEEEVPRLELKRKGKEEGRALQKKKKVVEEEKRGSEVPQFVPQPPLVELDPKLRESEEGAEAKNMTGARRFINSTFPEVDKCHAWDEALRYCGASVVKHVLEEKEELEKKNKEMQEVLDEVVPVVKRLEQERASLSTKLVFEESKRKISESEREAQEKEIRLMKEAYMELKKNVQLLVHNGIEEHIINFVNSSLFDSIVNLYRLPTAILAFIDCRKKLKAEYPEVDITKITFGEQEEGVEENGESMSVDFRPQIKLRWDHDADRRTIFPPIFDFEFVAVKEEGGEVEEDEMGARVEGTEVEESHPPHPVEIHPVPSDDEQPPLLDEQPPTQPPILAEQ
ncbi:hypothetical protein SLEP1_g12553 [Rubroshorea leprosula]|uniref:Uncharacterized protein n=1 Tax=Rubroshorea leprosula TaxID=152421 RepID=A0AAV5IIY0_9ROSI|nr:hypothetical protein SLEP1_g12553 [Rubroshorea leprosula]